MATKTSREIDDRTFVALAAQVGAPTKAQLRACRKLQELYRQQKGKRVSLLRIVKAKGLATPALLAALEGEIASGRKAPTRKSRRPERRTRAQGKVKVASGRPRHAARRSSNAPLFGALAVAVVACVGLSVWVARQPLQRDLALVVPSPTPPAVDEDDAWLDEDDAWNDRPAPVRVAPALPRPSSTPAPETDLSDTSSPGQVQAEPAQEEHEAVAPEQTEAPEASEPDAEADAETGIEDALTVAAGMPNGTSARVLEAASERFDAQQLLFEVYSCYDVEDKAGLGDLVVQLEGLGAKLEETHCARGLLFFLQEDFQGVVAELQPIDTLEGRRERDALARAAMFLGAFDVARDALDPDDPDAKRIAQLLDGPFRTRYPLAAAATETMTPEGHYRVITDLGLPTSRLDALERKLGETPQAGRAALVDSFRKKHKGLHEVTAVMDKAHRAYTKLFATEPRAKIVPTVFVFSEEADFHAFSNQLQVGSTENTLGYYVPRYRVLVFYDQASGEKRARIGDKTLNVLLHETFHQWLHLYVEGAPHWFNEGMAEYFGIAKMTRKTLHYGLVTEGYPSRLHNIRWALTGQIQEPMPLSRLLRADRNTFMGGQAAINYATAWSFVHFMASTKKGRDLLRDYFRALQDGLDLEQAYTHVFGDVDMNRLQASWKDYTLNLK